jgi:hypothetical protein
VYSACLFCRAALGANEALEAFPVGRRLAFDAAKGRLWVVCRRCERWNLTPLEERWEAVEEAERLFRDTRLRVSTDNVGLARLREGTELVRLGEPQRPEFAAWRYGDQFGRRRRRQLLAAAGLAGAGAAVMLGGVWAGFGGLTVFSWGRSLFLMGKHGRPGQLVARLEVGALTGAPRGTPALLYVERAHLRESRLVRAERSDVLALELAHRGGRVRLDGEAAARAAAILLPAANRLAGNAEEVRQAVARIERAGSSERFLAEVARRGPGIIQPRFSFVERAWNASAAPDEPAPTGLLALEPSLRLAFEMALHEEQERRAMEGELAELERAWREAETIAAIADDLLLPATVGDRLRLLKERAASRDGAPGAG